MQFNQLANKTSVTKTQQALETKGYAVSLLQDGTAALAQIKEIIPEGASVMSGSSVTLEQIGYKKFLESGKHQWVDLHGKITAEADPKKRMQLRRESVFADYYLGSVHALVENGEFVVASNTASQLPHVVFTSPNLIFVVSTKKIVPNLEEAMKRLEEYVVPLEDKHMQDLYTVNWDMKKKQWIAMIEHWR